MVKVQGWDLLASRIPSAHKCAHLRIHFPVENFTFPQATMQADWKRVQHCPKKNAKEASEEAPWSAQILRNQRHVQAYQDSDMTLQSVSAPSLPAASRLPGQNYVSVSAQFSRFEEILEASVAADFWSTVMVWDTCPTAPTSGASR